MTKKADSEDAREPKREQVLRARAERLARAERRSEAGEVAAQVAAQVAVIAVGDERFGVPAERIRELVDVPAIASLPGLPGWLPGLAQIRGELVSVVDLARLFGIVAEKAAEKVAEKAADEAPGCLVVVECAAGPLGLLASRNLGFRVVRSTEIAAGFSQSTSRDERPVRFVTRDLCAVLDLERLAADERLVVHQG
jgi:chemotaxis signal transduction protein